MGNWTYHSTSGKAWPGDLILITPLETETVGKRELEMLLRARRSSSKSVVIPHTKERNAERLALRRLCERGLFSWPNAFGGPGVDWLYRYNLTERGKEAWLRCR